MYYVIGIVVVALIIKGEWGWVALIYVAGAAISYVGHLKKTARGKEGAAARYQNGLTEGEERRKREEETFDSLVAKHLQELTSRKRQLVIKGRYGVVDEEGWNDEVQEFIETVYLPTVERRTQLNTQILSSRLKSKVAEYEKGIPPLEFSEDISPLDYEHFCSSVLSRSGWESHVTVASGDQGADIVASMSGVKVVLQCKKYSSPVGNKAVQEIHAAKGHYNADEAVVVTNAGYTSSARELSNSLGVHLLHHSDLARLTKILNLE